MGDGCKVLNWNYTHLSDLNYNDAISYVQSHTSPEAISCFDRAGSYFHYDFEYPDSSIVDEVNYFRLHLIGNAFTDTNVCFFSGIWCVSGAFGERQ